MLPFAVEESTGDPAFTVSLVALGISGLAFMLALFVAGWNIRVWRHSGARVTVRGSAWRGGEAQHFEVSVVNQGRSPITVNAVHLYASRSGRQLDPGTPIMILGSGKGDALEARPHRLEAQSSIELDATVKKGQHLYALPRYRVDVELATGRIRSSRGIVNQNSEY